MYDTLATSDAIAKTVEGLKARGFNPSFVGTKADAREKIKELIPQGASVMNGSSTTLDEIGFIEYLKAGEHGWNNVHEAIINEKDPAQQQQLRRNSVTSDFYLGSVHALSETGEMVIASNSGSQLPHLVFTSPNLILVVGAQKITATLADALERLEKHVVPLEDARALKAYGVHTKKNKTVILHGENPMMKRNVHVLIVNEKLGF